MYKNVASFPQKCGYHMQRSHSHWFLSFALQQNHYWVINLEVLQFYAKHQHEYTEGLKYGDMVIS